MTPAQIALLTEIAECMRGVMADAGCREVAAGLQELIDAVEAEAGIDDQPGAANGARG